MVCLIRARPTVAELEAMLETLETYIKLAVDIRTGLVAGGGEPHADCEALLLQEGGHQEDIWGADWIPSTQELRFEALINIRPRAGNRSMHIQDEGIRHECRGRGPWVRRGGGVGRKALCMFANYLYPVQRVVAAFDQEMEGL